MKTYLSIDVDYWAAFDQDSYMLEMGRFFRKVINARVPIFIVLDHEELLSEINKLVFNQLINVDYHSDITAYIDIDEGIWEYQDPIVPASLNCGTWVNFVDERILGEFLWLYPHERCINRSCEGRCEDIRGFWDKSYSDFHNWNYVKHKKGLSAIKWPNIISIGVSLSPDWLYPDMEEYFMLEILPSLKRAGAVFSQPLKDYFVLDKDVRV